MKINKLCILVGFISLLVFINGCVESNITPNDCPDSNTFGRFRETNITISNNQEAYLVLKDLYGEVEFGVDNVVFRNVTIYDSQEIFEAWYFDSDFPPYVVDREGVIYSNWGGCE